jgi:hypothetical protein
MNRGLPGVALGLALFLLSAWTQAQEGSEQALPEGHPAMVAPDQTAPAETPADDEEQSGGPTELPPGHPPVDQAGGGPTRDADSAKTDPAVPAGNILVQALDAQGHGLPGLQAELEVVRESVREGNSRIGQVATTREDGSASFAGLASDLAHSYRVRIVRDSATFASPTFALGQGAGTRVRLHVYPVTRDVGTAGVASVAKVYLLPQEQGFVVEAMLSVANFGAVAWVPSDVRIELPTDAEAFDARDATDTLAIVREGHDAARLEGTVGPGIHSVVFSFRVPRDDAREQGLTLGMPPRLVQASVMAEAAPGMTLAVGGLPPATAQRSEDGRRVLVTSARISGSDEALPKALRITVGGLPTAGPGRWVALLAALGFVLGGVVVARGRGLGAETSSGRGLSADEVEVARSLILKELGDLERAHRNGQVGPRTYGQARRELIDALARLEAVGAVPKQRIAAK